MAQSGRVCASSAHTLRTMETADAATQHDRIICLNCGLHSLHLSNWESCAAPARQTCHLSAVQSGKCCAAANRFKCEMVDRRRRRFWGIRRSVFSGHFAWPAEKEPICFTFSVFFRISFCLHKQHISQHFTYTYSQQTQSAGPKPQPNRTHYESNLASCVCRFFHK